MSKNFQTKVKAFKNRNFNVEVFDSANEVVRTSEIRTRTDSSFHDMRTHNIDPDWTGVHSLKEANELLKTGYQPVVDKLKIGIKANVSGQAKRITFCNDVVGYAPIVPLAIQGVPTSMQNSTMKPIKAKVVDVYYDITASCGVSKEQLIEAGSKLLAAIVELEMQGYKFNLYAVQGYWEDTNKGCDLLCVKVKSSNTPLDLKRISFPLVHPAFFRVNGFDWVSKTPHGKYRSGYGRGLSYDFNDEKMNAGFKELFGKNVVLFSSIRIMDKDVEYIKSVIGGVKK